MVDLVNHMKSDTREQIHQTKVWIASQTRNPVSRRGSCLSRAGDEGVGRLYAWRLRRMRLTRPTRPVPSSTIDVGSGTEGGCVVVAVVRALSASSENR